MRKQTNSSSTPLRIIRYIAWRSVPVLLPIFLLVVILALYVRLGLDGNTAARVLIPRIESAVGKSVAYSSADLEWVSLGKARMTFTNVKIADGADPDSLLSIPAVFLEIDAGTAWRGSITINRARFSRPSVSVGPRFVSSVQGFRSGSPIGNFILGRLFVRTLEVIEARISAAGREGSAGNGGCVLSRFEVRAKDLTKSRVGSLAAQGELSAAGQTGLLEFSGSLESAPPARKGWKGRCRVRLTGCPLTALRTVGMWYGQELPFSAGAVNLTLNINGENRRLTVRGGGEVSRAVISRDRVFGGDVPVNHASAEFALDGFGDSIQIDLPKARLPGLSISGEARLGKIFSEDATLTVALGNADIDLKKIFPLVPLNLLPPEERNQLVRAGLKGRVQVTGGAWSGKIWEFMRKPSLRGTVALEAVLDGVSGFIPGLGLPVENADGTVHVNADEMIFKGISLTIGSSPIVLNGSIVNLRARPSADLFISIKALAQDLYPLLTSNAFSGSFKPWLKQVIGPKGGVSVTLDLKGDLHRPSMKGKIALEDFQCGFAGFPLSLTKFNGSMRFRRNGIIVSEMGGLVGGSPAVLKGSVAENHVDLTCDVKLTPRDGKKLCRLPNGWDIAGSLPIVIGLKGKVPHLDFSIGVDLKNTALTFGSIIGKKSGTPLKIEASGSANPAGLVVEEASLILPENRIAANAKIDREGRTLISVNLPPKGIPTRVLVPFIHSSLELQPGGRIEGDAAIRIGDSGKPDFDAGLQFTHVSLRIPGFHKPTVGMVATLRQKGKTFHLTVDRARIGSSVFSGTFTATGFDHPKTDVSLIFSFLDTTDFEAPRGYVSPFTWGEWIQANAAIGFLARSSGKGFLSAAKGKTQLRTFSNFRANIEGKDGLLEVAGWQVNIADGTVRGTGLFDIRPGTKAPLVLDLQADRLRMESLMMSDPDWLRVEGDAALKGKLQWNISSGRANNGVNKTGNIEVRVHDGKINKFDILSKLFSLINLGSIMRGRLPDIIQQGLPFQSLTWNMNIFDTKWKFRDMMLISDAARITASGMYFSDQDRVDFQVDVSPLVGFDKIFAGLFGNLVTKNGKILTTTFRVRGLSKTPDVRLMPFENFRSHR
ncbi:MAG: AsmA-like C-terminal domain-containing protein [Pseudomonadota bacterium]